MQPVQIDFPAAGVARLRINRPEARNTLNHAARTLLASHFTELGAGPARRCIVLGGGDEGGQASLPAKTTTAIPGSVTHA